MKYKLKRLLRSILGVNNIPYGRKEIEKMPIDYFRKKNSEIMQQLKKGLINE